MNIVSKIKAFFAFKNQLTLTLPNGSSKTILYKNHWRYSQRVTDATRIFWDLYLIDKQVYQLVKSNVINLVDIKVLDTWELNSLHNLEAITHSKGTAKKIAALPDSSSYTMD